MRDVTTHPGLAGGAQAIAALYDMQHDPALREVMTYTSPTTGEPVGRSFDMPRDPRGAANPQQDDAELGARDLRHDGPLARFHERDLRGLGRGGRFLRREAAGIRRQHAPLLSNIIRENDVMLTHSLINLQRSRNVSGMFNLEEGTALQVVRETSAGIVVRGARVLATLGPLSDEIAVYSPRLGAAHRGPQPVRGQFRDPVRHARGCAFCAATASISGARISTIRSARASRRWIASCSSTTCSCRGSACSCCTMSTG